MSNSAGALLANPDSEWKKLSLTSSRLQRAENSIRQSHMYSILRTSSLADAKMYINWRLHERALSEKWNDENDRTEHNTLARKKRAREHKDNGA